MKSFFKYTLAAFVGVLLAGILFVFIGITCLAGFVIGTTSGSSPEIKDNTVFVLDLDGSVEERYSGSILDQLLGDDFSTHGLDDILAAIRKAKTNPRIKGICINAGGLSCPVASMQAIRNALLDFKTSGKFVVSYGGTYTQGTYYISSVSDKIIVNPSGSIQWHGLSAQTLFLKGLLDKIGVEMQIFRVGTYKSAVEPYIATEMSPANREQTQAFVSSIWQQMLSDISQARHIATDELNRQADTNMDFQPAETYIQAGLADTLMYKDEVDAYLKQLTDCPADKDLPMASLDDMIEAASTTSPSKSKDIITVYYAFGEIDGSTDRTEGIDSETMIQDLRDLREDDDIKAVVLRVNSPGGSAYGSEQIWREVSLLKDRKPVVVSMGDYAASGGYYISCAAHKIVAEPTTLTGSIGIFGMIPNAQGLMQDKLGLRYDGVKTNRLSDMGGISRALNPAERELVQNMVNQGYALFTKRCAEGRNLPIEKIREIAEGRVWTGSMAKELHLVDELGGLDKAIQMAQDLAELKDYRLESYPEEEGLFSSLLNTRVDKYIRSEVEENFGEYYTGFRFLKNLKNADRLQARMPFTLSIN